MIYLDNNATTRPTPRVVESMLHYLNECYFNASASSAAFTGADEPRRQAAASMAKLLNAEEPEYITFTSGATESNNWIFSSLTKARTVGRVLISSIEHSSIFEPAARLARFGFDVVEIPVDEQGVVRLDALADALTKETVLVSIMAANNETGVLEPMAEIGRLIRDRSSTTLFHTDATQAIGKIPVDLQGGWEDVHLVSFSAHKFHGPKGIGGLYVRPGFELEPMLLGGGQEGGLRSGTTNTPALAGLASAALEALHFKVEAIRDLRDTFEARLQNVWPEAVVHSRGAPRLPNTCYFSLPGMLGEDVADLLAAAGIIVGTGAACSAGTLQSSKTLRSMGVAHELASGGLRISLSRFSSPRDISELVAKLTAIRGKRAAEIRFRAEDAVE